MIEQVELNQNDQARFQQDLVAMIPQIRAFAHTFTGNRTHAEDLAQESVLRAWANQKTFEPGSNMRAWIFTIVRNQYAGEQRRAWRWSSLDLEAAERTLVANDNPLATLELNEVRQALGALSAPSREALILVTAGGLTYEQAATICNCAVGTVKSRVSRAKAALTAVLQQGRFYRDHAPAANATHAILDEYWKLSQQQ
ncbi:sigma-70 family RNA polymerase sigma factor [Phenylobacterium sp.]|jgi:RNA polymerase sigma-70 factor (ECF subfamily)|uniref:sigma-70 family RNA polymerase sigma factor n=1 Tax=Phenylobacterium sp. TaxID=1871053 RepID=UPI002F3FD10C